MPVMTFPPAPRVAAALLQWRAATLGEIQRPIAKQIKEVIPPAPRAKS
jgi:hypothetical protein